MKASKSRGFLGGLIVIVIAACVVPFFIKGSDDKPLMSLDRLKLPNISKPDLSRLKNIRLPEIVKKTADKLRSPEKEPVSKTPAGMKLYKWTDKNGVVRYSDRKSSDGAGETVYFSLEEKPGLPKKPTAVKAARENPTGIQPVSTGNKMPQTVNPLTEYITRARHLKSDAEAVRKQLEENYREQQRVLDDLAE